MGSLTVNVPGTPEGEPIEVPPFGLIPNGTTMDLTDELMDKYEAYMEYLAHGNEFDIDEDIVIGDPVVVDATPGPAVTEPEDEEAN